MSFAGLERLLILQDRDVRLDTILKELEFIPGEIEKEKRAIEALQSEFAEKEAEFKAIEVKHREIEGAIALLEESLVKYKTQQMEVKKNEEYKALENEIQSIQQKIDDHETDSLGLLEEQDTKSAQLAKAKQQLDEDIASHESRISALKEGAENFKRDLESAKEAQSKAAADVDPKLLQEYQDLKPQIKRAPYIVPMSESKCSGCHLKVSGEVDSAVRKSSSPVYCDNCGRMLYLDI